MILFRIIKLDLTLSEKELRDFFKDKAHEADELMIQAIENNKILDEGVFTDFFNLKINND